MHSLRVYSQERFTKRDLVNRTCLERQAKEGNSPVHENHLYLSECNLEYLEKRMPRGKQGVLAPKAKYISRPIVN